MVSGGKGMTRRSNDLLSIFDANRQAQRKAQVQATSRARAPKAAAAPGRPSGRHRGRGFQGLWLSPRQVVLAGCVGTLLLLLTFFVGLAMGRPGTTATTPALRRDAEAAAGRVLLELKVSALDMATGRRVEAADIRRRLAALGVPERGIVTLVEQGGSWTVHVGPFASEQAADVWIRKNNLAGAEVAGSMPFHRRRFVDLPAH